MSLREMHEQQKQSSPREQLQELNRQSRTELENSLLKEALAMSSENCEELMKQSNQEQVRAEQNRKLISELKQSVELLKNSNELLQDAISGEIGSLKDEVKENTVQEVRKALQANIEAIQRATKLLEKQSDTLTSVMKQKIRELEESKNSFFRYEGLKLYLFCIGWLYDLEFHYANTEAGRLEAVCDYIPSPEGNTISGVEAGTPVRAVSWQTIDNHLLIFFAADNEENVHGVMHLYSVNPVQILFLLCDFHKKYILCVLKLAAVSASHCTLVIKAILTNLFTKTLYISNIELYLANF